MDKLSEIRVRLSEIRARCDKATPGVWTYDEYGALVWAENPYGHGIMRLCDIRGWGHLTGSGACYFDVDEAMKMQDDIGKFIAHAREDIPYLLGEIERLGAENERLNDFERSQMAVLLAQNGKLERELEAAKRDLSECAGCWSCIHECDTDYRCMGACAGEMWVWRGLCAENGGTE